MKKLFCLLAALVLAFPLPVTAADTELVSSPWHLTGSNGDAQAYGPSVGNIANKASLRITYDLHGTCFGGGTASALIFDQNGWKYVPLSNYGQNCLNGSQTVTIPLSAWVSAGLNLSQNVGTFHVRFWHGSAFTVDITSAILVDTIQPTWPIQAVDAMKATKDKMCNQHTQTFIDSWLDRAVEIGATHIPISTTYQDVTCNGQNVSAIDYTMKWVNSIRAHNLKVWHRHPNVKFEGNYNNSKHRSPDGYRHLKNITDFIALDATYPALLQAGDIFTPEAEPQNGGISGVTYCPQSYCQFSSTADFNEWLRLATLTTKLALQANDIADVKVGYWGFDGFLVWGNNNPDHLGTSKIEAATVAAMDNLITIDHYPSGGDSMATDLDEARAVWPNADFFIGEWGTIGGGTNAQLEQAVNDAFGAFAARSWIKGVNYWQFGPDGIGEPLINSDFSKRAHFDEVESFYK